MNAFALLSLVVLGTSPSIDTILDKHHQSSLDASLRPVAICDDATFVRRITLDLAGRIPTLEEIVAFEQSPDRAAVIDRLLASDEFAESLADAWTASLVGYTQETSADREVLRMWLVQEINAHGRLDKIAKSLIAGQGQSAVDGPVNFLVHHRDDLGVQVCRQFLGVRLDCARCHDHPFARWTQDDFSRMNRFFDGLRIEELSEGNLRVFSEPTEAEEDDLPRFLTGSRPRTRQWRDELALYVVRSRPFARNAANRLWYHLMGRGIVDPPDELYGNQQPDVPELLEFLTDQVQREQFAIKPIVRMICQSHAYQRESRGDAVLEPTFAKRTLKPITPEQLRRSLQLLYPRVALESRAEFAQEFFGDTVDEQFLQTWKYRESVQSLLRRIADDVDADNVDAQDFDAQDVDDLDTEFLRVLSRRPTPEERAWCQTLPLATVRSCLLQTNEFMFNH